MYTKGKLHDPGEFHMVDRPWRCVEDRRLTRDCRNILGYPPEENPECDIHFDVNHACMAKFAGAEVRNFKTLNFAEHFKWGSFTARYTAVE